MCSLLSSDMRRKCRTIHECDQRRAGVQRYVDAGRLYLSQAEEFRRMGNPAGAARLEDMAADCAVVITDILAGRRRP